MLGDHARELMQHAGPVEGDNHQADFVGCRFHYAITSYFFSSSSQIPFDCSRNSITSRTAPDPPRASVVAIATCFTSSRAFAVAKLIPTRRIKTVSVKSSPM